MAGNILQSIENRFIGVDEDTIIQYSEQSLADFVQASGMTNAQPVFNAMVIIAKFGLDTSGPLSGKQKHLIDVNFSKIYTGAMENIYPLLEQEITDEELGMLNMFCQVGQYKLGIPLLFHILSYSYIDGKPSAALEEKLEDIFGMVLLQYFFNSEPEEEETVEEEAEPDDQSFRCFLCNGTYAKRDGVEIGEDFYVCQHCYDTKFCGEE